MRADTIEKWTSKKLKPIYLLVFLLASIAALFCATIFGGPKLPILQDELNFLYEALRLPAERKLGSYVHGPFLFEIIAVFQTLAFGVLIGAGKVSSSVDFVSHMISHQSTYLLAYRCLAGLFILLLCTQIFRLGKFMGGAACGLLATLLCGTNFTVHIVGTMVKEDGIYWAFLFIAIYHTWKITLESPNRNAVFAGLALAVATATKYLGLFSFVLVVVPLIAETTQIKFSQRLRASILMGIVATVGVFALVPFVLTDHQSFMASIQSLRSDYAVAGGLPINEYFFVHLPDLVGPFVLLLAAIDLILRLKEKPRGPILLILGVIAPVFFLGLRPGFSIAYYVVPFALFLCLLASSCALRIYRALENYRFARSIPLALIVIFAMTSFPFLGGVFKYRTVLQSKDLRKEAAEWVATNISPGSAMLITSGIVGLNFFGPDLIPLTPKVGKGVFGAATLKALEKSPDPRYDLVVQSGIPQFTKNDESFEWIILPAFYPIKGQATENEFKTATSAFPPGYDVVADFMPFPVPKSNLYPLPMHEDYESLKGISHSQLRMNAKFGHQIRILRNGRLEVGYKPILGE